MHHFSYKCWWWPDFIKFLPFVCKYKGYMIFYLRNATSVHRRCRCRCHIQINNSNRKERNQQKSVVFTIYICPFNHLMATHYPKTCIQHWSSNKQQATAPATVRNVKNDIQFTNKSHNVCVSVYASEFKYVKLLHITNSVVIFQT